MLVSVITLNYNTFKLTSDCIRSVIEFTKGTDFEIILVDNASTEKNAGDFLAGFPGIKLIKSPVNGGFAYGNNLGIEQASGEFILLLNSDTVLKEDSISKAIAFYQGQNNAGVVGCRMTYSNNKVQYSARRFRAIAPPMMPRPTIPILVAIPSSFGIRTRFEELCILQESRRGGCHA